MGVKKALLVGCNYPGTKVQLNGCANDVDSTVQMLRTYFGFDPANIKVLLDTDSKYEQPTGVNIRNALTEMVTNAQPGDVLMMHFSGHGVLVPDPTPEEGDADDAQGGDNAIVPTDMNLIVDDDLRAILLQLPQGIPFTMVSDCCHSQTLLDGTDVIAGNKAEDGPLQKQYLVGVSPGEDLPVTMAPPPLTKRPSMSERVFQAIGAILPCLPPADGTRAMTLDEVEEAAAAEGFPAGGSTAVRAITAAQYAELLSARLGKPVTVETIRPALLELHGAAASPGIQKFTADYTKWKAEPAGTLVRPRTGLARKPGPDGQLPQNVGILVTGCMRDETSADVTIGNDASTSHGALTYTLQNVLKANPTKDLTYRQLVLAIRENLHRGGYTQNPCLECDAANADAPFICPVTVPAAA